MSVRKNKGISMVGSMVALLIFSLILFVTADILGIYAKHREEEKRTLDIIYFLEYVRNDVLCNWTYTEAKEVLMGNTLYITGTYDMSDICSLKDIMTNDPMVDHGYYRIRCAGHVDRNVLKIEVAYINGDYKTETCFYKGDYEKD